jgi:hypothetical protein
MSVQKTILSDMKIVNTSQKNITSDMHVKSIGTQKNIFSDMSIAVIANFSFISNFVTK